MIKETHFIKRPFLRFTGGKQKLLSHLLKSLPHDFTKLKYYEPFFGAGSLFFATEPQKGIVSDANKLLIDMYQFIISDPESVYKELKSISRQCNESHYYAIRKSFNDEKPSYTKTAKLIFLNRTCYNGVFRVNSNLKFNVPWGKKDSILMPSKECLMNASQLLANCKLRNIDFEEVVTSVTIGDFIYLDPPYLPLNTTTATFNEYTYPPFNNCDFERFVKLTNAAKEKGAKIMISNPDLPVVREAFNGWNIETIVVPRYASSKKSDIKKVQELLITNYSN